MKFPVDAPIKNVIKAFVKLGFYVVREKEHISFVFNGAFLNVRPIKFSLSRISAYLPLLPQQSHTRSPG